MLKAVIFDVDGTLCDTIPLCIEAMRQAGEPFCGRPLSDEEILATFGPSEEGATQRLCPEHAAEIVEGYVKNYREFHSRFVSGLFEGIPELLQWLKSSGFKLGIVTGKGIRTLKIELELQNLDGVFDYVQEGMPYGPSKPWGIGQVLEHLGLTADEAIYVGDMVSDILSSRAVGMRVVAAAWTLAGKGVEELRANNPDCLAMTVADLRKYIEELIQKENR